MSSAEKPSRLAWWSLTAAASASTVISFNLTGTNIAFSEIQATFSGTGRTALSWAVSGYLIAVAAFLVLAGRLGDRLGRRKVFLSGLGVFVGGSLLAAVAPAAWVLIAGRVVQGVGGAMLLPTSLSMVLPLFPDGRRASAVAIWSAASSIGGFVAPSVSAVIVELLHWRALYLVCIPILTVSGLMVIRLVEADRPVRSAARLDMFGVPIGTLAVGVAMLVVVQGPRWGWTSVGVVGAIVAAFVLAVVFLVRSLRHPAPMIDFSMFRTRSVWSANVTNVFLSTVGLSIWWLWPQFLQKVWDFSILEAGLAISPGPVMSATFAIVGGRIADRHGARGVVAIGSLCPTLAVVWMLLFLEPDGNYWTNMLPAVVLMGTGFGLSYSPLNTAALVGVPTAHFGQANAVFTMLRTLGGAIGVAIAVAMLGDRTVGTAAAELELVDAFDRAFLVLGCSALLGAVLFRLSFPSRRDELRLRQAASGAQSS
ncbi:MAG: MFS transporter [Actinomycetota bacterium]|jgi:EmrB/QacA subfamily drug resistance transporter|nr:MFS transporter [Actinomycetota bacterium]